MVSLQKILIICGGNTCRSPMAKVILDQMLKSTGLDKRFIVDSAAYRGPDGTTAHPNARQTIKELYGEDLLANHVPKKLTKAMVGEADLIIVMEDYMKASLPANKVIALGIADPYGPDITKYKSCAAEIQQSFQKNWSKIVGLLSLSSQKAAAQSPSAQKFDMAAFLKAYGQQPRVTADLVYNEAVKLAEKVDFGRGKHEKTVTRLMLNMYEDLVAIGLINDNPDKRKLAEIIGLSHDIGVSISESNHNYHSFQMLKKQLWKETLSSDQQNLLAVVMYGVYYHREAIPGGKITPLDDIPLKDYRITAELVSLIRIADGLDYGLVKGSPDKIEKIEMARTSKGVERRVFPRPGENVNGLLVKSYEKREVFEATFGKITFWLPGDNGGWMPWQS